MTTFALLDKTLLYDSPSRRSQPFSFNLPPQHSLFLRPAPRHAGMGVPHRAPMPNAPKTCANHNMRNRKDGASPRAARQCEPGVSP